MELGSRETKLSLNSIYQKRQLPLLFSLLSWAGQKPFKMLMLMEGTRGHKTEETHMGLSRRPITNHQSSITLVAGAGAGVIVVGSDSGTSLGLERLVGGLPLL